MFLKAALKGGVHRVAFCAPLPLIHHTNTDYPAKCWTCVLNMSKLFTNRRFTDYTTYSQRRVSVYSAIVCFVNHYCTLTDSYIALATRAHTIYSEIKCTFHMYVCICIYIYIIFCINSFWRV